MFFYLNRWSLIHSAEQIDSLKSGRWDGDSHKHTIITHKSLGMEERSTRWETTYISLMVPMKVIIDISFTCTHTVLNTPHVHTAFQMNNGIRSTTEFSTFFTFSQAAFQPKNMWLLAGLQLKCWLISVPKLYIENKNLAYIFSVSCSGVMHWSFWIALQNATV